MTAVEWLQKKYKQQGTIFNLQFEQDKEMEKEQIKDAFDECGMWQDNYSDSEHYYNETFKSE